MVNEKNLLSGMLPLLVLSLLSVGDKYGYGLIEELRLKTSEAISLKSGTLYPLLHSLEAQNFVNSYEKLSTESKIRRYYHLTTKGLLHLQLKTSEWDIFAKAINEIVYEHR